MNTATRPTTSITLSEGFFSRRSWLDWLFAALVLAAGGATLSMYGQAMDVYETGILIAAVPAAIWLGWFWRPLAVLMVGAGLSLLAISSYHASGEAPTLARADTVFWLKYFLSSQSAILWMSMLVFMSTIFYWLGLVGGPHGATMELTLSLIHI